MVFRGARVTVIPFAASTDRAIPLIRGRIDDGENILVMDVTYHFGRLESYCGFPLHCRNAASQRILSVRTSAIGFRLMHRSSERQL